MHAGKGGRVPAPTPKRRRGTAPAGDDVFQALRTTLQLLARRVDFLLDEGPPENVARDLRRMRVLTDDIVRRLRQVDRPRRDGQDAWTVLLAALRRLGTDFARSTGASVEVKAKGAVEHVADEVVEVLFGVACEAFRNIERHGRASVVLVMLVVLDSTVVLEIRDDGLDLAQREADWCAATRTGVLTAAELAESVGGRVVVASSAPRGLRLVAEVPCLPSTM